MGSPSSLKQGISCAAQAPSAPITATPATRTGAGKGANMPNRNSEESAVALARVAVDMGFSLFESLRSKLLALVALDAPN